MYPPFACSLQGSRLLSLSTQSQLFHSLLSTASLPCNRYSILDILRFMQSQAQEGCSANPVYHPTWLLLKKSLADSFLPLRCDRWQALVKTSYLRAPSTVGPFCLPVPHPPFPTPTIPVQSGNHASALSSSWSSPFPFPRLASLWSIMHTTQSGLTLTQLTANGGV